MLCVLWCVQLTEGSDSNGEVSVLVHMRAAFTRFAGNITTITPTSVEPDILADLNKLGVVAGVLGTCGRY